MKRPHTEVSRHLPTGDADLSQPGGWLRLARAALGILAAILPLACSDGPTAPQLGDLRLSIVTTGVDLDVNGYELVVSAQAPRPIGINGVVEWEGLNAGTHTLGLQHVATNCSISGGGLRTLTVPAGGTAEAEFNVTCERAEKIAYVADTQMGTRVAIALADGSDVVLLPGWAQSPAWSPDGGSIVVSTAVCDYYYYYYGECSGGLTVTDLETNSIAALPSGSLGFDPAWSPDGELIAFMRIESSEAPGRLYLTRLDGSPAVELSLPGVHWAAEPAWSPDGQRIAFSCQVVQFKSGICVVNRDGSGFVQLSSGASDRSPAWSPDGTRIAFVTDRFESIGIALMTPTGSDITRVTSGFDPAWSRDGTKLVFAGFQSGLFTVSPDGSNLTRLGSGPGRAPAWRP